MPVGEGTSTPHMTWSDRKFVTGEAAYLETAGVRHRYHVPMVRALHLGTAPQRLVDTSKAVIEGIERALEVARPGNTCEQVEAAWRAGDLPLQHREGIRVSATRSGSAIRRIGASTRRRLRPGDRTVLQKNMTFHMVCGIWNQDWGGVSLSEPFHIYGQRRGSVRRRAAGTLRQALT